MDQFYPETSGGGRGLAPASSAVARATLGIPSGLHEIGVDPRPVGEDDVRGIRVAAY